MHARLTVRTALVVLSICLTMIGSRAPAKDLWINSPPARALVEQLCYMITFNLNPFRRECLAEANTAFRLELPTNSFQVANRICESSPGVLAPEAQADAKWGCYRRAYQLLSPTEKSLVRDDVARCRADQLYENYGELFSRLDCFKRAFTASLKTASASSTQKPGSNPSAKETGFSPSAGLYQKTERAIIRTTETRRYRFSITYFVSGVAGQSGDSDLAERLYATCQSEVRERLIQLVLDKGVPSAKDRLPTLTLQLPCLGDSRVQIDIE